LVAALPKPVPKAPNSVLQLWRRAELRRPASQPPVHAAVL